jgi:thiol-disulfide isomerase/thioredoxin
MFFKYPLENNNLTGATRGINFFTKQELPVDSMLSGKIRNYYVTCELSNLYALFSSSLEDFIMVDSFIKDRVLKLSEEEIKFINQEKDFTQKILKIKYNLEPGDKASGFYLKDTNDTVHRLFNYEGKLVYLHFWATWCEPCIKEIPTINELYNKLNNKPIVIINICLDDNIDKWKQIIERENFKGINLICKGNWENSMKSKYFIDELPHYTLIDQKGLIIKNFCNGPNDIYNELLQLIEKK